MRVLKLRYFFFKRKQINVYFLPTKFWQRIHWLSDMTYSERHAIALLIIILSIKVYLHCHYH